MGFTDQNSNVPARGERVARYVESYLATHRGLSLGELAFRLKVDKRDLQRLIRDRSCGWRMEDALAAYFGPDDFADAIFAHLKNKRSIREAELVRELAEINARETALERDRMARRGAAQTAAGPRLVPDQAREEHAQDGR